MVSVIALGHFGTFFKVNKQVTAFVKAYVDDSPTQWDSDPKQEEEDVLEESRQLEEENSIMDYTEVENKPAKMSPELEAMANDFYQHHKEQMIDLFPEEESFIVWYTRSQRKLWQGLWEFFPEVYAPHRNPTKREPNIHKTPYYKMGGLCLMATVFAQELEDQEAIPHVAFLRLDENWGSLSEEVPNKTTNWTKSVREGWRKQGCSEKFIQAYLDHNYTRAVITTQFQILDHPKVHSLPLGITFIDYARRLRQYQLQLTGKASDRTQLMMISHKERPFRDPWVNRVIDNFHGQVKNTYDRTNAGQKAYYQEMMQSKFILSPGGLGMDTYRHYESISLGTFPIIETLNRTDGWHRTLADLPVAWIDSYDNLNAEFLEKEYVKLVQRSRSYKYEKLTRQYWIDFIRSHLENASIESLGSPYLLPATWKTDNEKKDESKFPLQNSPEQAGEEVSTSSNPQEQNQIVEETVEPGSLEEAFYSHHREKVLSVVNQSSAIIWNTRAKPAFMPLYNAVGDVYRVVDEERFNPNLAASPFIFWGSICEATKAFGKYRSQQGAKRLPHVLFFRMNENWGGFSETIPGKTAEWVGSLEKAWKKEGCTKDMIFGYLDHPDTRAAFTVQFQVYQHPKVYPIPLGIAQHSKVPPLLKEITPSPPQKRSHLLMVNHKPRSMRDSSINKTIENFGGTVRNTYGKDINRYFHELSHSKFILSPGGLGFDCYRHWEAITIGTIPVLETLNRKDGWFRVFDDLPVAWIDRYENLTPEFLEEEYQRIISKVGEYNYEKLTIQYWVNFIRSFVADVVEGAQNEALQ
jgi:hypothetical protein